MTGHHNIVTAAALAVLGALTQLPSPVAAQSTWIGATSTDWNTASNWNPNGVPVSTSTPVIFTDFGAGTVNVSSTADMAQSLTFNNPTTSYTLTSSAGIYLTVGSAITATTTSFNGDQINLANIPGGSLIFPAGNNLTISNNDPNFISDGPLTLGPNTVIGTPGAGTSVIFTGPNAVIMSGSFASGTNAVTGGLMKTGPGSLQYTGSGAFLSGGITLNGGFLELDYSLSTTTKLFSGALTLGGGLLRVIPNAGTPVTQSFSGGTAVNAGHTDVTAANAGTFTLNAGNIVRTAGGTVDFTPSASSPTFSIQTSTGNSSGGLLGNGPAFATVNGGTNWAVQSGVVIAPLAGFSVNIYSSNDNTDVTANANPSAFTTNSLRFNVPNLSLGLTGTNVLQSGGILVTPNGGGDQITGASATLAAGGGEMIVHQYSTGPFTIGAAISAPGGLTKTGPGALTLSGNNTGLTGPINVNRGDLTVSGTTAAVNSASAINFNDDRAALFVLQTFTVTLPNGTNGTITPPIRVSTFISNGAGTFFSTGNTTGSTVTLSGIIGSPPGLTTPIGFTGEPSNSSGFNLTNTNSFLGNVTLDNGSLGITSDASLGNAANQLMLRVNSTVAGGLVFLNSGITVARPIVSQSPTRIVSNGTDNNTISGPISGTGGIIKDGTGTLTTTNVNTVTGGVTVQAGTLSLGMSGGVPAGTNVTVASGATFSPATAASLSSFGTVTLNGGTFRVPAGNMQAYILNQLVAAAGVGGTVDFTGAGADQLYVSGITVGGSSAWLSPANGTTIIGPAASAIPITIAPGVMLTNGIALGSPGSFQVTGGGTLYQNSDATNVLGMTANLTVSSTSTFRVMDAASNGGVGNLGTGLFTLDGGTFDYGGTSNSTGKPIALTNNGGTIQVESAAATLTANGPITGLGSLTKTGAGTLVLTNMGNSFTSLNINAGTVQTGVAFTLGTGPITVGPLGTLAYTGSVATNNPIILNGGTLSVAAGGVLILGPTVAGGFLRGPGEFAITQGTALVGNTTFASTTINQTTGPASYTNFTNGGTLAVFAGITSPTTFNGFTNQGSGTVTIGAGSQVNAADFETYGTLTLVPGSMASPTQITNTGSSPLYFNGGSRTFLSIPAHAGQFDAGIDLHGQNAVVAGGLFVNNGYVVDSVGAGTKTVVADFGSLVKGAGFYQNSVQTVNGGKFQSGNSPGKASFGSFTFGPGGVSNYVFAIDNATGTAGPSLDASGQVSGWGLVKTVQRLVGVTTTTGDIAWTATPTNKLTVSLDTLLDPTTVGTDNAGPMANFDPTKPYTWLAASWAGNFSGPTDPAALDASTAFDTSEFVNPIAGTFVWRLDTGGHSLSLTYTPSPVPEPDTLALAGLTAVALARRRGRQDSAAHQFD